MRLRGHSEHDDHKYVLPAVLEAWRRWDPVDRIIDYALAQHHIDADGLARLRTDVDREIDEAIRVAEAEPMPEPSSAGEDVFRLWRPEWNVPAGDLS